MVLAAPTAAEAQAEFEAALAALLANAVHVDPLFELQTNHTGEDLTKRLESTRLNLFDLELDSTSEFYAGSRFGDALDDPGNLFNNGVPFTEGEVTTALDGVTSFADGFGAMAKAQLANPVVLPWTPQDPEESTYGDTVTSSGDFGSFSLDSNGNASSNMTYNTTRDTVLWHETLNVQFDWNRTNGESTVNSANVTYTRTPQTGGATQRINVLVSPSNTNIEVQKYVEGPNPWSIQLTGNVLNGEVTYLNSTARFTQGDTRMMAALTFIPDESPGTDDRLSFQGEIDRKVELANGRTIRAGALVDHDQYTTQGAARVLYHLNDSNYVGAMAGFHNDGMTTSTYGSVIGQMEMTSLPVTLRVEIVLDPNDGSNRLRGFTFDPPTNNGNNLVLFGSLSNDGIFLGGQGQFRRFFDLLGGNP